MPTLHAPAAGAPSAPDTDRSAPVPPRAGVLGRRPPLPSRRATLGGLLVAVAVVGTLALGGDDAPATTTVVVAARDLGVGARIDETTTATVEVVLPDAQGDRALQPASVDGTLVAAEPLAAGDVVHDSDVRRSAERFPTVEVGVALAAADALGGSVAAGDAVDVIGVRDGCARRIVSGARIRQVDAGDGGFAGSDAVVVLAVADPGSAVAIVAAGDLGRVVLVRPGSADADTDIDADVDAVPAAPADAAGCTTDAVAAPGEVG